MSTAVIALASTLISTLQSITTLGLYSMSAQDGLGCAIPLPFSLFFFQSVTSKAFPSKADSFTLSNNLPGLLSGIANVGCRG